MLLDGMSVKYDLVSRDFKMGRAEHNLATKQKTEKEEENKQKLLLHIVSIAPCVFVD